MASDTATRLIATFPGGVNSVNGIGIVTQQNISDMLSPYRVLDLADEEGLLCGKLLGDLGADVIKIERPGGDSARNVGPFYHDEVHPEKSLFWFALNTSKRGITLNIEKTDGKEIFKRLVKSADFVIESLPPGHMDKLGLGYSALEKINPRIIVVSITPFGQAGPYRDYKAPDIVAWATGGRMYPVGDADRPPVRISHYSQAYLHAGAEAAAGALVALHYRETTGEGQHVDVSVQACVAQLLWATSDWDMTHMMPKRGSLRMSDNPAAARLLTMWPCKDGYIVWLPWGGPQGRMYWPPLVKWMDEEGMATDFLKEFDWGTLSHQTVTGELADAIVEPTAKFFMAHTRAELLKGAVKHKAMLCPVATTSDILESPQLAARGFWTAVEHPELGTTITYPGAFAHSSATPPRIRCRAPLIGEHNGEVYEELGFSKQEILILKQANVI
jgi:crotonobetainyl-CoA:carnitine CoA-transferase CaiB-like acyl-CoA transferase